MNGRKALTATMVGMALGMGTRFADPAECAPLIQDYRPCKSGGGKRRRFRNRGKRKKLYGGGK